ncbi:MAG: ABC transporter substrate-binding protein [Nitrospinota bacterium]
MRRVCLFAAVVVAALLLGGAPLHAGEPQGTLAITWGNDLFTFDPHTTSSFIMVQLHRYVFDGLAHKSPPDYKLGPYTAEGWKWVSPKVLEMRLRRGIKFTNGEDFDARAVRIGFKRIRDPKLKSRQLRYFRLLERVEEVDKHTVRFHFKKHDATFLLKLPAWGFPVPPKYYSSHPPSYLATHPVGSGPYKLVKWVKNHEMILEANENYWRPGIPKIKRIVQRPIPELGTRVAALLKGELDVIRAVPPHLIPKIRANPNLKVEIIPAVRIMYMGFVNYKGGPLADVRVRKAINHALDFESIRTTIMGGLASPIGQLFHPWTEGHVRGRPRWYPYNPQRAKELLREAGYPNGFSVRMISPTGRYPKDRETGQAIVGQLARVGIRVNYTPLAWSAFVRTFRAHRRPGTKPFMVFMGFGNGGGISDSLLIGTVGCGGSWSPFCDKEIDAAIDRAASEADDAKRYKIYSGITDLMKKKATHAIFFRIHDAYGVNKRVRYRFRPDERIYLWEASVAPTM